VVTPTSVDDYMAALPDDRRARMEQLRQALRDGAPGATELISYQMPAFKSHGQFLVSYAAYKRHDSLFPATPAVVNEVGDELTRHLYGSGTIRFAADEPLPLEMVTRIVRVRFRENADHERR
jgi:uncharacterized protein YdhG (YjbR/CyaY superfamily)